MTDIVKNTKKTPPKASLPPLKEKIEMPGFYDKPARYPSFAPTSDKNSRIALWGLASVCLIFLFFALSTLFTGATVTIAPRAQAFSLAGTSFTAAKDNASSDLTFQTMTLTDSASKVIVSSKMENISESATGRVIIYNAASSAPQKLIINTRLETPDGKIFRLDTAVTVPGFTASGGQTIPGSVETAVHADQAGSEYNIGLSDFTIPGFKGTPKYSKFYARSKTEMAGGVKGNVYVADKADADAAAADISQTLKDRLAQKAAAEAPKGFVLFPGASSFELGSVAKTFTSATANVPVSISGTFQAVLLDEQKMTDKIAALEIKNLDPKDTVYIPDLKNLAFAMADGSSAIAKNITFTLSGTGNIVWAVDENAFKADLASKRKSDLKQVLADYPNISRAEAVIKPFWRSTFPSQAKDIKIISSEAGE